MIVNPAPITDSLFLLGSLSANFRSVPLRTFDHIRLSSSNVAQNYERAAYENRGGDQARIAT
jgi:hypothetical protein